MAITFNAPTATDDSSPNTTNGGITFSPPSATSKKSITFNAPKPTAPSTQPHVKMPESTLQQYADTHPWAGAAMEKIGDAFAIPGATLGAVSRDVTAGGGGANVLEYGKKLAPALAEFVKGNEQPLHDLANQYYLLGPQNLQALASKGDRVAQWMLSNEWGKGAADVATFGGELLNPLNVAVPYVGNLGGRAAKGVAAAADRDMAAQSSLVGRPYRAVRQVAQKAHEVGRRTFDPGVDASKAAAADPESQAQASRYVAELHKAPFKAQHQAKATILNSFGKSNDPQQLLRADQIRQAQAHGEFVSQQTPEIQAKAKEVLDTYAAARPHLQMPPQTVESWLGHPTIQDMPQHMADTLLADVAPEMRPLVMKTANSMELAKEMPEGVTPADMAIADKFKKLEAYVTRQTLKRHPALIDKGTQTGFAPKQGIYDRPGFDVSSFGGFYRKGSAMSPQYEADFPTIYRAARFSQANPEKLGMPYSAKSQLEAWQDFLQKRFAQIYAKEAHDRFGLNTPSKVPGKSIIFEAPESDYAAEGRPPTGEVIPPESKTTLPMYARRKANDQFQKDLEARAAYDAGLDKVPANFRAGNVSAIRGRQAALKNIGNRFGSMAARSAYLRNRMAKTAGEMQGVDTNMAQRAQDRIAQDAVDRGVPMANALEKTEQLGSKNVADTRARALRDIDQAAKAGAPAMEMRDEIAAHPKRMIGDQLSVAKQKLAAARQAREAAESEAAAGPYGSQAVRDILDSAMERRKNLGGKTFEKEGDTYLVGATDRGGLSFDKKTVSDTMRDLKKIGVKKSFDEVDGMLHEWEYAHDHPEYMKELGGTSDEAEAARADETAAQGRIDELNAARKALPGTVEGLRDVSDDSMRKAVAWFAKKQGIPEDQMQQALKSLPRTQKQVIGKAREFEAESQRLARQGTKAGNAAERFVSKTVPQQGIRDIKAARGLKDALQKRVADVSSAFEKATDSAFKIVQKSDVERSERLSMRAGRMADDMEKQARLYDRFGSKLEQQRNLLELKRKLAGVDKAALRRFYRMRTRAEREGMVKAPYYGPRYEYATPVDEFEKQTGIKLGLDADGMYIMNDLARQLKAMNVPGAASTDLGHAMGFVNWLARTSMVTNPIVHTIWNQGMFYLMRTGDWSVLGALPRMFTDMTGAIVRKGDLTQPSSVEQFGRKWLDDQLNGPLKQYDELAQSTSAWEPRTSYTRGLFERGTEDVSNDEGMTIGRKQRDLGKSAIDIQTTKWDQLSPKERVDRVVRDFQDWNNDFVFNRWERFYAARMMKHLIENEEMPPHVAAEEVRSMLGSDKMTPFLRNINQHFAFVPWMRTVIAGSIKLGLTKPQTWNALLQTAHNEREQQGYNENELGSNPFRFVKANGAGGFDTFDPLMPNRILEPIANAALGPGESQTDNMGNRSRELFNYGLGHLYPAEKMALGAAVDAITHGKKTWLSPYNPKSPLLDQILQLAGSSVPDTIYQAQQASQAVNDPAQILTDILGGRVGHQEYNPSIPFSP